MVNPTPEQPQVISHRKASTIAREVHNLIRAGNDRLAWERLSWLHPADMGTILAGLPKASRDSLVRVMDPETVTWMLRQMNPWRPPGWQPVWGLRPFPGCWGKSIRGAR